MNERNVRDVEPEIELGRLESWWLSWWHRYCVACDSYHRGPFGHRGHGCHLFPLSSDVEGAP